MLNTFTMLPTIPSPRQLAPLRMCRHIDRRPRRNRILMFPQTRHSLQLSKEIQPTLSIKVGI